MLIKILLASLVLILKFLSLLETLMFGWDFEDDAWSRFWRWNLIKICSWICDKLVSWTQPSGLLCLWQCLFLQLLHFFHRFENCFLLLLSSMTSPSAVLTFGLQLIVLHCNYNGDVAPTFDLGITFDQEVPLTQGRQHIWTACKHHQRKFKDWHLQWGNVF